MRTIQLYDTGSATANAVAQITLPSKATLKGALIAIRCDCVTDNGNLALEWSKVPVSQIATNGAQDAFLHVALFSNFATSGLDTASYNNWCPIQVPCRQGEIIYLHAFVSGTVTYYATVIFNY